jgi:hypothetical protein
MLPARGSKPSRGGKGPKEVGPVADAPPEGAAVTVVGTAGRCTAALKYKPRLLPCGAQDDAAAADRKGAADGPIKASAQLSKDRKKRALERDMVKGKVCVLHACVCR